jgi:SpoVK/Ycf46/Vps4 family AAA+-type ATPase
MISKANPDLTDVAEKGKEALASYTLKMTEITVEDLADVLSQMSPMTNNNDLTRYRQWASRGNR